MHIQEEGLNVDQHLVLSIIKKHHPNGNFKLFETAQPMQGDEEGVVITMPSWIREATEEFEKIYGHEDGQKHFNEALKMFFNMDDEEDLPPPVKRQRIGRNEQCPCGSGKKYKHCCIN